MSDQRRRFYGLPVIPVPAHESGVAGAVQHGPTTRRRVIFAAVGSSSDVPALEVTGETNEDVAGEVLAYIRPLLCAMTEPFRPITVTVDLVLGAGHIRAGGTPAGYFIVREASRE